ncbi:MAG: PAS domain-containing protein [Pseudomonadota bacterium]
MLEGHIVTSSAGSLCVATVALLVFFYQYRLYLRKPDYAWNGWGAALSLSTCVYAVAVFIQFNASAGPLNLFAELIQYTCFALIQQAAFGYTLTYLVLDLRWVHTLLGIINVTLLGLLWFTDLVLGDGFVFRDFLWLQRPYVEPGLGPLGPLYLIYIATSLLALPMIWYAHRRLAGRSAVMFGVGFAVWASLGFHDILATLGVNTVQFLMEYGFLGFSVVLLMTSGKDDADLEQMLAAEKDRLTVTIQAIGDGFISTDLSGAVLLYNKEAERLCGWHRTRIIGKPIQEVYYVLHGLHRTQRNHLIAQVMDAGGSPIHFPDDILIAMNGDECRIAQTLSLIQDNRGRAVGMVVIFRPAQTAPFQ